MSRRALLAAPLALGLAPASAAPQPEPLLALFERWRAVRDLLEVEAVGMEWEDHPLIGEESAQEAAMLATPPCSAAGLAVLARVHIAIFGPCHTDGSDADYPEHRLIRAILEGAEALAERERA